MLVWFGNIRSCGAGVTAVSPAVGVIEGVAAGPGATPGSATEWSAEVADVVGGAGEAAQLSDSRGRFVARSDDPIEVRHGGMAGLEVAEGKLRTAADQDDVGAQLASDAARRFDHGLMVSTTDDGRLTQTCPLRGSRVSGDLRLVRTRPASE
jgi:hypothetical protein